MQSTLSRRQSLFQRFHCAQCHDELLVLENIVHISTDLVANLDIVQVATGDLEIDVDLENKLRKSDFGTF